MTRHSLSLQPIQVLMLLEHDVRLEFFDINFVEMGVEAAEVD